MAAPKPTIIVVPGAWHRAAAYSPLTSALESAGYTCIGVDLPSVGTSPPLENFEPDVRAIRSAIETEIAADHDVVVFMHSYGSVPSGEAVKGLDKASVRKDQNKTAGVTHLVYCTAFAPPKGGSLIGMLNGEPLPWFVISSSSDNKEDIVNPARPQEIFYNDVASADVKTKMIADLEPFSYRTFFSKTTWEPWRTIPATYIFCTDDKAIPIEAQRGMVDGTGGSKAWNTLEEIDGAGHSPFLVYPERVAKMVRKAAGEEVV